MPRKPIAEKPMTSAERTRKHRQKLREEKAPDLKKCLRMIASLNKQIEKQRLLNELLTEKNLKLAGQVRHWNRFTAGDILFGLDKNETTPLTDENIKLLKQLCHPDKHNGSPASTRAITLLNKIQP
jgi:hypothetical protein